MASIYDMTTEDLQKLVGLKQQNVYKPGTAEFNKIRDEANALRAAYGGFQDTHSYDQANAILQGRLAAAPAAAPAAEPQFDVIGYINQLTQAKQAAAMAGLQKARDASLSSLTAEEATIKPKYYDARNVVSAQSQLGAKSFAEYLAQRGELDSGVSDEAQMRREMALQGNIGDLRRQEVQDIADIARRRSGVQSAYESDLASVRAGIEAASLERYIDEMQRQRDLSRDDYWRGREFDYRSGRDTIADERYDREFDYQKERDTRTDMERDRAFEESVRQFDIGQENWQQQFTHQQMQDKIQNALAQRRISNEQAQIALQQARFYAEQDPNSLDNQYKKAQIDAMQGKSGLQYRDYITIGRDMLDKANYDSVSGTYNHMYNIGQVRDWALGLPLDAQQKANLLNDLGIPNTADIQYGKVPRPR